MTLALTSTGLTTRTLQEIKSEIETELRSEISSSLDLSPSSPQGQMVAIFSRQARKLEEAFVALYNAMNPAGATGAQADILARLTGTTRRAATSSRVSATVNVDPGTYVAGSLVAAVDGNPDALFENAEDVVNAGGAAADVVATFTAQDTGPVSAPSGTLDISGPVSGWNSITTAADATLGLNAESDAELLVRREQEVQAQGSTTVDAIRADISQNVGGVISATVIENDTDATVDGIPPHAFEAVVYGPASPTSDDDQAVADQILNSKPVGIQAHGTTTKTSTDAQGNDHTIKFTRPTSLAAGVSIDLEVESTSAVSASGLQVSIAEEITSRLGVGDSLDWSELVKVCFDLVGGLIRVTDVQIGPSGGPLVSMTDYTATARQIVTLTSGDVSLTITEGTP